MMVKNIRLTVTEQCNLNCVYCYEKNKSERAMSFATAKRILDVEFATAHDSVLNIEFFGGEPLLNFELIRQVSEYVIANRERETYSLSVVTNGTQLTDTVKKWLWEHKDLIEVGFSIDGDRETQDINRSRSFDLIDFSFVAAYPKSSIKMTISPISIKNLAQDVIFLHRFNRPLGGNLDYDADWDTSECFLNMISGQLEKLINFYVENPLITPCSFLDKPLNTVLAHPIPFILKTCGAGTSVSTYDVNGNHYPCQAFMPLSEDRVNQRPYPCFLEKIPIQMLDSECQSCPIVNSCPNCYASNYFKRGSIYAKSLKLCPLIKLAYKASAYLKYLRIVSGAVKLDPEEEARTLEGIRIVNEKFVPMNSEEKV